MENTEVVKRFVEFLDKSSRVKNDLSPEEKKQAAYALNMCTVSVSQIIDYKDLNILEQEYDAILNNINLEHMPKDEALLNILKQLLDTITYFRIQEGDKKMIEKEYQHKLKNAIWSAVPNFGLIVAGGSPLTMAISLASQVGIGYMNYRRNKAEYNLDKEKQMLQLQRTAIEQFNGLRRELFNTAWRLADTYGFEDELRLTEKQITQYNQILMDQDEIRKYERLEAIKEKFTAYPPFWYFIGNAANYIAGNQKLNLSKDTRKHYREKALEYFEEYEKTNKYELLREDQIASSCALEHIDLLLLEEKPDLKKVGDLLKRAIKLSGNSNDILELCAITYLKLNDTENASKYLRILVNEDYNRIVNAQLLSGIYVRNRNRTDYELLATRVDNDYLYPMPADDNQDVESLEAEFGAKLKSVLKLKYQITFENLLQRYSIEWNKLTSQFDVAEVENDDFYLDTPKSNAIRRDVARQVLADSYKAEAYAGRISQSNYELGILDILNRLCDGLFKFDLFQNPQVIEEVENEIRNQIITHKDDINDIQQTMTENQFGLQSYNFSQTITLRCLVGRALKALTRYACSLVDKATINEITSMEASLRNFCLSQKIDEPEIAINRNSLENSFGDSDEIFGPEIFGRQAILAKQNAKFLADMSDFVKEKLNASNLKDDTLSLYFIGDPEFNSIFFDSAFDKFSKVKSHALLVMKDNSKKRVDLIFTTNGIVHLQKNKIKNITPYSEVELKNNNIILYHNFKYSTTALDTMLLFNAIKAIGSKFVVSIEDKVEYITEPLSSNILVQWFKNNKASLEDDVTRVIAIPKKDVLEHIGYHLDAELDENKNLLQYYSKNETGEILGLRIIRFENIDSNLQSKLLESQGILRINTK